MSKLTISLSTWLLMFSLAYGQRSPIKITYELRSYGGHKSYQVLKLLNGVSHFALRKEDEEITDNSGITYFHPYAEKDVYIDNKEKRVVMVKMYERKYPVISSWPLQSFNWNITQETREILGYKVQKAVESAYYEQNDEIPDATVTAWFAPDLPYSGGPNGYYGLPGLILELSYSHKQDHYVAYSINTNEAFGPIKIPDEGYRVSKDQMVFPVKYPVNRKALKEWYRKNY
ncbi:MAG: hypothetical protein KatS3mg032_2366 [Cyclobacteriaceae bacterium]|nr:MAG: hypothetical protein KatS3mg032_2366 [Cyclobacteriaceae bacterium]